VFIGASRRFQHDHPEEEDRDPRQRRGIPEHAEIDVRTDEGEIDEEQHVVERESDEAQARPEDQAHAAPAVAAQEQRGACQAGERTKQVHGLSHRNRPFGFGMRLRKRAACRSAWRR